ncbi:MAG: hypothetical protein J6X11_12875, partial [Treponema sp.]|nr:hypothetical protein [Treponema sp.]
MLGIVRIILFITFFANERNENLMALLFLAWIIITVIDFILILFGKFKDKNKLPISSFNPKKDYEKFQTEKMTEEDSKESVRENSGQKSKENYEEEGKEKAEE